MAATWIETLQSRRAWYERGSLFQPPPQSSVNVVDYGGDPTGATDSLPAFLAAQQALAPAGGMVVVPAGTFVLDGQWTLLSNTQWVGCGAASVIRQADGSNQSPFLVGSGISNSALRDLVVDYNGANNPDSMIGMKFGEDSSSSECSYINIVGCQFINALGFAIGFAGGPDYSNTYCRVLGNVVVPVAGATTDDLVCFVVDNGEFAGNLIFGPPTAVAGLTVYECSHPDVHDNTVVLPAESTGNAVLLQSCSYALLHSNTVIGPGTAGGNAYTIDVEHDNPNPNTSQRNKVYSNVAYNVETGLYLAQTNYDEIYNNRFDNCGQGILFAPSSYAQAGDEMITNNYFINCGSSVNNGGGGVFPVA